MAIKARKLTIKPYHLINQSTKEFLVVTPPLCPGDKPQGGDPQNKASWKNDKGEWIRQFTINDHNGVATFRGKSRITLTHMPKVYPSVEHNGDTWMIAPIEKVATPKVKTAKVADPNKEAKTKARAEAKAAKLATKAEANAAKKAKREVAAKAAEDKKAAKKAAAVQAKMDKENADAQAATTAEDATPDVNATQPTLLEQAEADIKQAAGSASKPKRSHKKKA
jgi:hypothetical protein